MFLAALLVGVVMLAMIGLILGGVMLLLVHHMWDLGQALASALYLFSGAIFPLDVLPVYLRPIGYALPVTYWLELLRRSLVGQVAEAFPTLQRFSNLELMGILLGLSALFSVISIFIFRWCEQRAREQGKLDMVSNY